MPLRTVPVFPIAATGPGIAVGSILSAQVRTIPVTIDEKKRTTEQTGHSTGYAGQAKSCTEGTGRTRHT